MVKTLTEAAEKVEQALPEGRGIEEVVADKGYHSTQRMVDLDAVGLRSYVSEPRRGKRRWRGDRQGQEAVYANRRRIRGERGQRLLRQRGEQLERPCAHLYGSGGMRRLHVRGLSRQSQPSLPAPVLKNLLESLCFFSSLGVRDLPQDQQGRLVHSLRELGQQVDDPMIPAALLLGLGIDVAQSSPDAQVAVSDHQPWTAHPPALQVAQYFRPALGRFPIAARDRHHGFASVT